jgi:hypothetical protein
LPETLKSNPESVRVRVLERGHDRVFTGRYDEAARAFTKFASGEEFPIARDIADALVARGFVTIVCETSLAPVQYAASAKSFVPMPDDSVQRANWSLSARERLARHAEREADTGCLNWRGARTSNGYGGITFLGKTYTVHRLAWLAHRGPIPSELRICHSCDNRLCLEPSHLFLGTPQQNTIDMIQKGRGRVFGGRERLDKGRVASIKRRLLAGESVSALAAEMSVSINTIGDIKRGRTWTFVEPE